VELNTDRGSEFGFQKGQNLNLIIASPGLNKLMLDLHSQLLPVANRALIERRIPESNVNSGFWKEVREAAAPQRSSRFQSSGPGPL